MPNQIIRGERFAATRGRPATRHSEHVREFTAWRDGVIAAAVKSKKIAADRADDYRKMFTASPLEVHRLLTATPADGGLVAAKGAPSAEEYPADWLPEVHRVAAGRVMSDEELGAPSVAVPVAAESAYPAQWTAADLARPSGDVPRVTQED